MSSPTKRVFWVADLNTRGELQLKQEYDYATLEQIPGAAELIGQFASHLWRDPGGFETSFPHAAGKLTLRWRPSSETAGIATVRCSDALVSVSLLVCGLDSPGDSATLGALQQRLLQELRDTPHEPAFDLLEQPERPLVATMNVGSPTDAADQHAAALADRCFAAAYFRIQGLA